MSLGVYTKASPIPGAQKVACSPTAPAWGTACGFTGWPGSAGTQRCRQNGLSLREVERSPSRRQQQDPREYRLSQKLHFLPKGKGVL